MRGVMDHLQGGTQGGFREGVLGWGRGGCGTRGSSPVEQQQQRQHRQVGGGDVGVLLETHEDDDDQRGRDDVVTLEEDRVRGQRSEVKILSSFQGSVWRRFLAWWTLLEGEPQQRFLSW